MSVAFAAPSVAPASAVRAFALANGLPAGGSRGRLPFETIKAFNKANGLKYSSGKFVKSAEVTVTRKGKTVTRKVDPRAVRRFLIERGEAVPARDRLSAAHVQRAFDLLDGVAVESETVESEDAEATDSE